MSVVYLMFDGSSEDGRGQPNYVGKTNSKTTAKKHHNKCKNNPYSTGRVMVASDSAFVVATDETFKSV